MENEKALARIRELEEQLSALGSRLSAAEARHDEQRDARVKIEAELATTKAQLLGAEGREPGAESLIADGKAYRQYLKEEVKRLAGILKSEAEASLLLKALPHAPAEALKELLDSYQRKVEEKFPPRPLGVQETLETPDARRQTPGEAGPARPVRFS